MARTLLFTRLRRAMRLAQVAEQLDIPHDEVVDRWREGAPLPPDARTLRSSQRHFDAPRHFDPQRRRILQTGLTLAGGALASACLPQRLGGTSRAQVVIVGAGIAGLTAAYRLKQSGIDATLIEAQTRVGGRMLSIRNHFADGQVAELGGELIDTGHARIRALAAELGIALDDFEADDPALRREIWWFGGRARSEHEVVDAFRPLARQLQRDLEALENEDGDDFATLDAMSIDGWLDRAGARGWIREAIRVAYTTEMGLPTDRQSALNLVWFIDPNPDPFRIFGESDERFHVRGGNDLIPTALGEKLAARIETGTVLEALVPVATGGYTLTVRQGSASRDLHATHVILALPLTLLRKVALRIELPQAQARAFAEIAYGTNAKLMIGFSERVWRTRHRSNGSAFSDLALQTTWETSRMQPGSAGIITNFTGGQHGLDIGSGTAAEQAELAVRDLERMFPGVAAHRAGMTQARMHWPTNPWVQGSYLCFGPGQYGWGEAIGAPVGRVFFAGEHTSIESQGFMEGGCESGERAAAAVLADLGVAAPWAVPAAEEAEAA